MAEGGTGERSVSREGIDSLNVDATSGGVETGVEMRG